MYGPPYSSPLKWIDLNETVSGWVAKKNVFVDETDVLCQRPAASHSHSQFERPSGNLRKANLQETLSLSLSLPSSPSCFFQDHSWPANPNPWRCYNNN